MRLFFEFLTRIEEDQTSKQQKRLRKALESKEAGEFYLITFEFWFHTIDTAKQRREGLWKICPSLKLVEIGTVFILVLL